MTPRSTPPELLWHYTDVNGLWGILTSRQLRFGDARFLNDRTEKVYGERLLEEVLQEAANGPDGELVREMRLHMGMIARPDRLYVCSFSETSDSIGQWQRYGSDGAGYCIGFDCTLLDKLFERDGVERTALIYSDTEQRAYLKLNIQRCVDYYRRSDTLDPLDPRQYEDMFTAGEVTLTSLRLKSSHFMDEHEWRVIFTADKELLVSANLNEMYGMRGPYLKPFILLPRPHGRRRLHLLPIRTIVCGPKLDRDLAVASVERLLESEGYDDVTVERSALANFWR